MTVVAHVSDVHLGAHDEALVAELVADVAAHRPDLTVVTGDLTMRAREEEFALASELLERLPAPRLVVLGNHDVPLHDLTARLSDPYVAYQEGVTGELDPVLDMPEIRVLGLQSMPRWRWKSGRVSRRQSELVLQVLGAGPRGALRVLALHHPLSAGGLERLAGLGRLRAALADAEVDLVLAGHTHVPAVTPLDVTGARGPRRVIEVVAGTGGSSRTRGTPASWTCITASGSSIRVVARFRTADGWIDGETTTVQREISSD